jgi:hypothetical protein
LPASRPPAQTAPAAISGPPGPLPRGLARGTNRESLGKANDINHGNGWVNYFAVGHSSECFSFIKDWVEKKVRRHLAHAQKRKGFGWERWNRRWLYDTLV